jgi:hypothetical protein
MFELSVENRDHESQAVVRYDRFAASVLIIA